MDKREKTLKELGMKWIYWEDEQEKEIEFTSDNLLHWLDRKVSKDERVFVESVMHGLFGYYPGLRVDDLPLFFKKMRIPAKEYKNWGFIFENLKVEVGEDLYRLLILYEDKEEPDLKNKFLRQQLKERKMKKLFQKEEWEAEKEALSKEDILVRLFSEKMEALEENFDLGKKITQHLYPIICEMVNEKQKGGLPNG